MADSKHFGFEPTYGYVEEIRFKPLQRQCEATYKKPYDNIPSMDEVDNKVVNPQGYVEENNLTLPDCKCLRH